MSSGTAGPDRSAGAGSSRVAVPKGQAGPVQARAGTESCGRAHMSALALMPLPEALGYMVTLTCGQKAQA